jgi:hypothetical protein
MHAKLNPWKPGRFPAHGELTVDWEGALMLSRMRGPFNTEAIREGMSLLAHVGQAQWPADGRVVEVVEWIGSMLMSPEALGWFGQCAQRFFDAGFTPVHTVVIAPLDVEGRSFVLPALLKVWTPAHPTTVFTDPAEGLAFAHELRAGLRAAGASMD